MLINCLQSLLLVSVASVPATSQECEVKEQTDQTHGNDNSLYYEEGGWRTHTADILVEAGPCHLPILDGRTLTNADFLRDYAYQRPFVVRDATNQNTFRALCQRERILADWGDSKVVLSSANSYSYDKRTVSFRHYCDHVMAPQKLKTFANGKHLINCLKNPKKLCQINPNSMIFAETFYFFGDNDVVEWEDFFAEYKQPPYKLPMHSAALSFGVAGPGTGVPFHFHGPGFAETLFGRKRWFLTQPEFKPEFHPNKTTLQWFLEDYERVREETDIMECTLRPGEVRLIMETGFASFRASFVLLQIIYFPDRWWHATLNIDTSVFMSTFLSP